MRAVLQIEGENFIAMAETMVFLVMVLLCYWYTDGCGNWFVSDIVTMTRCLKRAVFIIVCVAIFRCHFKLDLFAEF